MKRYPATLIAGVIAASISFNSSAQTGEWKVDPGSRPYVDDPNWKKWSPPEFVFKPTPAPPPQTPAQKAAAEEAAKAAAKTAAINKEKADALAKINVPRKENPEPGCNRVIHDNYTQCNNADLRRQAWDAQEDARIVTAKERAYKAQQNASRMIKRKLGWDNGSFTAISQPADIASAGGWGTHAECPIKNNLRGAVVSACGSGANADCQGHPVQTGCAFYTSKRRIITTSSPGKHTMVAASRWGERVTCPDGQVIVGICGSGSQPNCNGRSHHIYCASFSERGEIDPNFETSIYIAPSESQWIPNPNWGGTATCPSGMVATGFCGSGANKDCNGNVVELRCSTMYANETPLN